MRIKHYELPSDTYRGNIISLNIKESSQLQINIELAYRFNQALALGFLNAYDKENNGI